MRYIPSLARFREFVSLLFGRHLQHLDDESRLVFYPLRIAPEGLVEKILDVGLKLLPSLIRSLLTHAYYPLSLKKNDEWFHLKSVLSRFGPMPSPGQLGRDDRAVPVAPP